MVSYKQKYGEVVQGKVKSNLYNLINPVFTVDKDVGSSFWNMNTVNSDVESSL